VGILRQIAKWYRFYLIFAFIALIPAVTYKVIKEGWPKKILFFVIPGYAVLSWASYIQFKGLHTRRNDQGAPRKKF